MVTKMSARAAFKCAVSVSMSGCWCVCIIYYFLIDFVCEIGPDFIKIFVSVLFFFFFLSFLWCMFCYCTTGGHSTFFAMLNSFVHIVMYFYYMIAAMGPKYQKYIWWKRYACINKIYTFEWHLIVNCRRSSRSSTY